MTADFMYQLTQLIFGKYQNGYITPEEWNRAINQSQYSFANYLLGQFQSYVPGRPQARVSWGQNQNVRETLSPIIYGYILNADINGLAPYPGDYQKTDAVTSMYGAQRLRFISQDRLFFALNDVNTPIATNPIYLVKDTGFQFYPITTTQARLSYVRTPPNIVWAYTLDADGLPVYNEAQSDDPIWQDVDCFEIVARCLRMFGVSLQDGVVSQYANEIKMQGQ